MTTRGVWLLETLSPVFINSPIFFYTDTCYNNTTFFMVIIIYFYCRHLAQGTPAPIKAAAFQITKRIITIVFVRRAIQVFIARKVN